MTETSNDAQEAPLPRVSVARYAQLKSDCRRRRETHRTLTFVIPTESTRAADRTQP
jgi:hypothetical protein